MDYNPYEAIIILSEHPSDISLSLVIVYTSNGINGFFPYERFRPVQKMPYRESTAAIDMKYSGYLVWTLTNAVVYRIKLGMGEGDSCVWVADGLGVHKKVRSRAQRRSDELYQV